MEIYSINSTDTKYKEEIEMNKAQYDDIYTEWIENDVFLRFEDYEEEEAFARALRRLHH